MKTILIAALFAGSAFAANPSTSPSNTNPDNTRRNREQATTAENQSEAPSDRELTRRIRSALVDDGRLSSAAKNVKVITANGRVTLRGPVNTHQEKQSVGAIAEKLAGKNNVANELEPKR